MDHDLSIDYSGGFGLSLLCFDAGRNGVVSTEVVLPPSETSFRASLTWFFEFVTFLREEARRGEPYE
jgi:hypothetical protein